MEPTTSTVSLTWFLFALIVAGIAQGKNRSGFGWFILACLFGPFALFILLLCSNLPCPCPNCTKEEEDDESDEEKSLKEKEE